MSRPDFKRLLKQDLPNAPDWIDQLLDPINLYFEQTYTLWNGGISFDNMKGSLVTAQITTPANYSDGTNSHFTVFTFPITFTGARFVMIGSCSPSSGNYTVGLKPLTIPAGAWREANAGRITISYITGLAASTTYNAVFQVF